MHYRNEEYILKIIKLAPAVFILFLSIVISVALYLDNQNTFQTDKELIKTKYIQTQKELTKSQVDRVHNFILSKQKSTENRLKNSIKERVYDAHAIATNIYEENKNKGEKVVKKMIQDALRTIKFNNNRGYFFIYAFDYECILLPVAPHLEGKSFYNFKEGKGEYLTRNIISQMKEKGEGYMNWYYHKPSDMKEQYRKIGFNKHFKPYNWFIGTGEYLDNFEKDVKSEVLEHISKLKYHDDNYIFIFDYAGQYLTHPLHERLGLYMQETSETETKNGNDNSARTFNNFYYIAQQGSGFTSYIQSIRPKTLKPAKKTAYIKGLENWEWIVGKGFYDEDVTHIINIKKEQLDQKFKNNFEKILLITLVLTTFLIIGAIYFSRILEEKFKDYKQEIKNHLDENTKQHNILAQQSKMAAIGEMIGNIAHQWRQPLSLIATAATGMRLKQEMHSLKEEELLSNLDSINTSAQYLSRTIDDFRNFFSSDKEKTIFNIEDTLTKSINLVSAQFKNKDIILINNIQRVTLFSLENELIQVLLNILNNARDELIKIEEKKFIFIETKEINNQLIITITDNAGGIQKDVLDHVFEPYYTTKHKSQGTGIGLYMAREIIVKHMDGHINIKNKTFIHENTEYKGAEVTIIIDSSNKILV